MVQSYAPWLCEGTASAIWTRDGYQKWLGSGPDRC
jgi:hypothetical protein